MVPMHEELHRRFVAAVARGVCMDGGRNRREIQWEGGAFGFGLWRRSSLFLYRALFRNWVLSMGGTVVSLIDAETSRSALLLAGLSFFLAVVFFGFEQHVFALMMASIGVGGLVLVRFYLLRRKETR